MSTPPKLNYALLGLNDVFPFVDYDQNILIKGVLEAIGTDFEIPAWELEFWLLKKPIPFERLGLNPWLLEPSADIGEYATKTVQAQGLLEVWTLHDHKRLHAVLQRLGMKHKLSSAEYPAQKLPNLEEVHQNTINSGLRAAAPSLGSKVASIAQQQEAFPLYNGRPPQNCGLDIRLFHPVFENFTQCFHGTEELVNEEEEAVHNFLVGSANYYDTEEARWAVVIPFLQTLLGHNITKVQGPSRTSASGTILFSVAQSKIDVPLLLFELKNEIGTGDVDATHQVGLLYRKHWSQMKVHHLSPSRGACLLTSSHQDRSCASCCPTFLLVLMGSWLCVLGAVFTDKPIIQPLTPLLWLGHVHAHGPQYREVTRLFAVLSASISELEEFYSNLDFNVASRARFFPYITSFTDRHTGHNISFVYEAYADLDPKTSKAVFIASTQDGQKIIVKFTEAYNEEAHSILAARGLAPPLLSCDRSTFSDFTMVVMGYVADGKQLFHRYPQVTPHKVLEEILGALQSLHERGLVFGDLRSPNVLITDQHHVQLVDFDWCGKVWEGKYPADISLVGIEWPNGVVPGGFLRPEHDLEMLRKLTRAG